MKPLRWITGLLLLGQTAAWAGNVVAKTPTNPPLPDVTFVAYDTETTGFSPDKDRLVEIGAVKFRNGKILARKQWLVKPGMRIPWRAIRVHGITDAMVADQPGAKEVIPKFTKFLGDAVVLAHNASFDVHFVSAEAARNGVPQPKNRVFDTLSLSRNLFPEIPSHRLETLVDLMKIPKQTRFHRALLDADYTAQFFMRVIGNPKYGLRTLKDLEKKAGSAHLFTPPVTKKHATKTEET